MSEWPSLSPATPDPAPSVGVGVPPRRDLGAFPPGPLAPVPELAPPARRRGRIAIGVALAVVAAFAAFTVLGSDDGVFPDRIGNYERMHDTAARSFEDQLAAMEADGVTLEGAMYSEARSSVPAIVVIVVHATRAELAVTPLEAFMRGAAGGFAGSGAGSIDVDGGISETRAGTEFLCAPVEVSVGVFGDSVACGWKTSDEIGMVFVTHTSDLPGALDRAEQVHGALRP